MADESILEVAKSQLIAFNDKNWGAAKEVLATDTVYDEVATQRRIQGVEEALSAWKGWAKAFPDAKGQPLTDCSGGRFQKSRELINRRPHDAAQSNPIKLY
jgi:hypothetical protein